MFPGAGGGAQQPYPGVPQQQFMSVQQQQQMMMMMQQQQRFAQQQQPMYNQPMNPGFAPMGMGMMPPGNMPPRNMPPPPQYTPQMAQNFRAKQGNSYQKQQKLIEEQRKQMEQAFKQKQFHEQQKRLKEFSVIGGRKMDADSLIESIIGKSDSSKHPANRVQSSAIQSRAPVGQIQDVVLSDSQDDGFGDFLTAPGGPPITNQAQTLTTSAQPNHQEAAPVTNPTPQTVIPTPEEKKKDLVSMMMECSDLTAPQKAKGFVKKSVKEVQPVRKHASAFQESRQSRHWDASTDQLTELFTLPTPDPAASAAASPQPPPTQNAQPAFVPPKWVTGASPVPDVYTHVLEASLVESNINTERLYPILLRSNLPREVLGHLWALCNKGTPGQLTKEELYMLLAMISVAQNNLDCTSLNILLRCPQAPIPNLGQAAPVLAATSSATQGQPSPIPNQQVAPISTQIQPQPGTPQGPPTGTGIVNTNGPQVIPPSSTYIGGGINPVGGKAPMAVPSSEPLPNAAGENDFADFQAGPTWEAQVPPVARPTQSSSFGDFTTVVSTDTPTLSTSGHASLRAHDQSEETTEKNTAQSNMTTEVPKNEDLNEAKKADKKEDIDEYFIGSKVPPLSDILQLYKSEPFKRNTRHIMENTKKKMETEFPVNMSDTEIKTDAMMPDFDSFGAFSGSQSETSSSQSQGWTSNSSTSGQTSASSNPDDPDFASAGTTTPGEDFADFQQASDSIDNTTRDNSVDKYSALKALVMDSSLFVKKPADVDRASVDQTITGENEKEDWAEFSSGFSSSGKSEHVNDDFDAFKTTEPGTDWAIGSTAEAASSSVTTSNWAAFSKPGPDLTSAFGYQSVPTFTDTSIPPLNTDDKQNSNKIKVDKSKAEKLFAHNLKTMNTGLASVSISAFDTAPPELPDMKDDEEEFDEFGTFQTSPASRIGTEGISSLAAGFDDLTDLTSMKTSRVPQTVNTKVTASNIDASDSISISSNEFSDFKSQSKSFQNPDTNSMQSLDLRPIPHVESFSSAMDNQSVSSLDLANGEISRKSGTPQDESRSVASLELKVASEAGSEDAVSTTNSVDQQDVEENFGEFSSATQPTPDVEKPWPTEESAPRPRNVSEIMAEGDLLTVRGDRYSELIKEPQDTDKHVYHWQRCLEKAKKMLSMAADCLLNVSNADVGQEIVSSEKGTQYLRGIVEIYRVICQIKQSMKALSISSHQLGFLLKDIEETWANLTVFLAASACMPEKSTMDFSKAVMKAEREGSQERACGICLLDVTAKYHPTNIENGHKLTYAGRQYHSTCANFWLNCVDSTLPALIIPELL